MRDRVSPENARGHVKKKKKTKRPPSVFLLLLLLMRERRLKQLSLSQC